MRSFATIGMASRLCLLAVLTLPLSAGATEFAPERLTTPDQLRDVRSKTIGDVSVSVSILTDQQARRHFGVDFARHELQALWISVRNGSDRRLWFIQNTLDPDFYSADEAALLVQGDVPKETRQTVHQYFRDESIRRQLAPKTISEGFVFLPRVEGGRYVDIRLQADAYGEESQRRQAAPASPETAPARLPRELRFDFALPLPDGDFDYERLDPTRTYAGRTLPDLTLDELRATLERLPCCAMDADGKRAMATR